MTLSCGKVLPFNCSVNSTDLSNFSFQSGAKNNFHNVKVVNADFRPTEKKVEDTLQKFGLSIDDVTSNLNISVDGSADLLRSLRFPPKEK